MYHVYGLPVSNTKTVSRIWYINIRLPPKSDSKIPGPPSKNKHVYLLSKLRNNVTYILLHTWPLLSSVRSQPVQYITGWPHSALQVTLLHTCLSCWFLVCSICPPWINLWSDHLLRIDFRSTPSMHFSWIPQINSFSKFQLNSFSRFQINSFSRFQINPKYMCISDEFLC